MKNITALLLILTGLFLGLGWGFWRDSKAVQVPIQEYHDPYFTPACAVAVDGSTVEWRIDPDGYRSLIVTSTNAPSVIQSKSNLWFTVFTIFENTNYHRVEIPIYSN